MFFFLDSDKKEINEAIRGLALLGKAPIESCVVISIKRSSRKSKRGRELNLFLEKYSATELFRRPCSMLDAGFLSVTVYHKNHCRSSLGI